MLNRELCVDEAAANQSVCLCISELAVLKKKSPAYPPVSFP